MLVSYDKENKFSGLITSIKQLKELKPLTKEITNSLTELFNKLGGDTSALTGWVGQFDELAKSCGTTDKAFIKFLETTQESGTVYNNLEEAIAGYQTYLKTTNKELTLADIKTKTLSASAKVLSSIGWMAIITGISWAVSTTISELSKLSQVQSEVRKKANELGQTFSETETSISDYKKKIEELYKTINDSSSSISDVTSARKTLMSVQDELIEKFGSEKGAVENITSAIYGQVDALDRLTKSQWQSAKNEFNNGSWQNDFTNWTDGYSNNIDRMLHEYEDYSVTIDIGYAVGKKDSQEALDILKQLEDAGANITYTASGAPLVELSGDASEVYEKLVNIQTLFSGDNPLSTENFRNHLTSLANTTKDVSGQYEAFYKQYILYEKIFTNDDYANSFNQMIEAYQKYQDAFASGNEEAINLAIEKFATTLSNAISQSGIPDSVGKYFNDMYPEMASIVNKWEFKAKVLPTIDLSMLKGKTEEDILYMFQTDGIQEGEDAFNSLIDKATEYGICTGETSEKVKQLIEYLKELGIIQSDIPVSVPDTTLFTYSDVQKQAISDYVKKLDTLETALVSIANKDFENKDFIKLTDEFKELSNNSGDLSSEIQELIDNSLADLYETLGEGVPQALKDSLDAATESAKNAANEWSVLNGQLDSIQSAYNALMSAQEEYNQYGAISIDTLQALLNSNSEYLQCLIDENGQLRLNGEAYQAIVAAKLAEAESTAVAQAISELDALTKTDQTQNTYDYIEANSLLAQSLAGLSGNYDAVMTSAAAAAQAQALSAALDDAKGRGVEQTDIDKVMSRLNSKLALIKATSKSTTGSFKGLNNAMTGYSKSSKSAKSATEELTDSLKKQKEELEKTKDKYDDIISAINWFYDKQIDGVEKVIDGIEKQNDQLDKQKNNYDNILAAIDDLYQREIDGLDSQIDLIQDKIDALKDANDEQERQLALEKAQYAWEQAQLQRTKYLYNGTEFVYETDHEAISNAREDLNDAELDMAVSKLEKEQAALQDAIDELEKYRQKWAEVADSYQKYLNDMAAKAYFGYNWESVILQNRLSDIGSFEVGYNTIQQKINDNQSLIDSYNEKIAYYESLKAQWESLTSKYEDEQNIQLLMETFGTDYEKILLEGRTKSWDDFANEYYNVQVSIKDLSKQIEDAVNNAASAAENAVDRITKAFANMPTPDATTQKIIASGGPGFGKMRLETRHSGILDGPVGKEPRSSQDAFKSLYELATNDKLKQNEVVVKLLNGEVVLNKQQQSNIVGNIYDLDKLYADTLAKVQPGLGINNSSSLPPYVTNNSNRNVSINQNIRMELPNVRTSEDVSGIQKELSRLYLDAVQYFNRH